MNSQQLIKIFEMNQDLYFRNRDSSDAISEKLRRENELLKSELETKNQRLSSLEKELEEKKSPKNLFRAASK